MSFTAKFLEEIGIQVNSVPQGLTAEFTTTEETQLCITLNGKEVTLQTKAQSGAPVAAVKESIAQTLIDFGAQPAVA